MFAAPKCIISVLLRAVNLLCFTCSGCLGMAWNRESTGRMAPESEGNDYLNTLHSW